MKIRNTYILRDVAGENLVVPIGESVNFNSVITLNSTGKFLWEQLQNDMTESELIDALLKEYNVERDTACKDVSAFIDKLKKNDMLD